MLCKVLVFGLLLLRYLPVVIADGNDWVDVDYIIRMRNNPDKDTAVARNGLLTAAGIAARNGPWSVQTPKDQLPPSKNANDYLSFAPYYWPDCNWCSSKRGLSPDHDLDSTPFPAVRRRMTKRSKRYAENIVEMESPRLAGDPALLRILLDSPLLPVTAIPAFDSSATPSTTSSDDVMTGTPDPAQARAKTTQASKCTQSPTTSMAPTATWTSCPYKNKDGQANPDTRHSAGPNAMNAMSQAVLYTALSYATTGTRSYSQVTASFLDTFFLTPTTAMTANVNYGQVVRGIGPEHQKGTFTGVLDMRGMVKVANAILALKTAQSPDWDAKRDGSLKAWVKEYTNWLETNPIAKKTASSANNHASFFYGQLAAVKLLVDDIAGAKDALNHFFSTQFLDHIASSGEQPFEAVRTKPLHYRCFNLEAIITAAKLGDHLGLDFWTTKTRNGATIQTAVDFAMNVNPGSEPITNIFPHVAAVAAVYGDTDLKYATYLQKHANDYKKERYWLYNQPSAFKMSPAARRKRAFAGGTMLTSSDALAKRGDTDAPASTGDVEDGHDSDTTNEPSGHEKPISDDGISFQCPAVFDGAEKVELDNGLFVTCDQLKPFYVLLYPDQE